MRETARLQQILLLLQISRNQRQIQRENELEDMITRATTVLQEAGLKWVQEQCHKSFR